MASGSGGKNLRRTAAAVRSIPNQWARESAKVLTTSLDRAAASATGGDGRLSGVPNGKTIRTRSKVAGDTFVTAEVTPAKGTAGQWAWIESGTAGHAIKPRRKGALLIPGVGVRRVVRHPGTRGKRAWSRTVTPLLPKIRDDAAKRVSAAVKGR